MKFRGDRPNYTTVTGRGPRVLAACRKAGEAVVAAEDCQDAERDPGEKDDDMRLGAVPVEVGRRTHEVRASARREPLADVVNGIRQELWRGRGSREGVADEDHQGGTDSESRRTDERDETSCRRAHREHEK